MSAKQPSPKIPRAGAAYLAWGLSTVACAVAFVAWAQSWDWQLGSISAYQLFPLFGLVAFSIMWSQYVVTAISQGSRLDDGVLKRYFEITGLAAITAILIHPSILVWQLWRDGFGLPPSNYLQHYVAPSLRWAALIGSTSLLVFVAYEFRRKFGKRPWWRFFGYAVDLAMLGIFVHGLALGSQLQAGWFRVAWFGYGVTLVVALASIYARVLKQN